MRSSARTNVAAAAERAAVQAIQRRQGMASQGHGHILRESSMSRSVDDAAVLITNSRDRDMADLSQALTRRGIANLLWFFDARDEELVVDAAPGRFRLQRGEQVL